MPTVRGTVLEFLHMGADIRRQRMEEELHRVILNDEIAYLTTGLPSIVSPNRDAVERHIFSRKSCWLALDATPSLLADLEQERPFGLYLRPYATESFSQVVSNAEGRLSITRSVEISSVGLLPKSMPVYGLHNSVDFNTLAKYMPVWIPPEFRAHWQQIVHDLARYSTLIVINATSSGTGFNYELREIPTRFPEKTWLLAGAKEADADLPAKCVRARVTVRDAYISDETARAVGMLASYDDHVSKPIILRNGDVSYAEPLLSWVRALVEAALRAETKPTTKQSLAKLLLRYFRQ